jgi:hypothetical protein
LPLKARWYLEFRSPDGDALSTALRALVLSIRTFEATETGMRWQVCCTSVSVAMAPKNVFCEDLMLDPRRLNRRRSWRAINALEMPP